MFISVLVPALNEIQTVGQVLDGLHATMSKCGLGYETILIDDGSTDGTGDEARRRGVRVIRHEEPRGYGAALMAGAEVAQGDWLLFIDADGTYPAEAIPALLAAAPSADMVIGARIGPHVHIPPLNRAAKIPLRWLVSYIAGQYVPDFNSGLRLVRRQDFERLRPLLPARFSLTTTLTVGLPCQGRAVTFIPIDYARRLTASKFTPLGDTWRLLRALLRVGLVFKPARVLLPPAGLLALGGLGCWAARAGGHGGMAVLSLGAMGLGAIAVWQALMSRRRTSLIWDGRKYG